MFFGATAFGQSPFGSVGETIDVITITPAANNLTLTLSNAYTVQKTHFVNGFTLNAAVGSVNINTQMQVTGQSATVSLNSPTVIADGTIHLPANSLGMTVSLGATIGVSKFIATGTSVSTTVNSVNVSGTALPTINTNAITSAVGTVQTGTIVTGNTLDPQVAGLPAADTTFVVTVINVGGSNIFVIDGVQKPTLTMTKGRKYIFDVSDDTNATHPLRFATTSAVPITDGVVVTGTQGQAGAKVEFTVPFNAFETIAYYCTTHGAGMGNSIDIKGTKVKLAPVAAVTGTTVTSAVGSVIPKWDVFVNGQSITLALNSVGIGYATNVSGNSITTAVGTTSAFTFSDVDDTTTATIPLTSVDTSGAGGSSWTEISETGAGTIDEREVA